MLKNVVIALLALGLIAGFLIFQKKLYQASAEIAEARCGEMINAMPDRHRQDRIRNLQARSPRHLHEAGNREPPGHRDVLLDRPRVLGAVPAVRLRNPENPRGLGPRRRLDRTARDKESPHGRVLAIALANIAPRISRCTAGEDGPTLQEEQTRAGSAAPGTARLFLPARADWRTRPGRPGLRPPARHPAR